MGKVAKIGTVVASIGFVVVAAGKAMQGEMPNATELLLAVSAIGAAFGFQFGR